MTKHFIPVALDTYFRGNSQELAFCDKLHAGGNHLVAATAGGRALGKGRELRLREKELTSVLDEFRGLPEEERRSELEDPSLASPPKRPVPQPPPGGLIVRGFCMYLRHDNSGVARPESAKGVARTTPNQPRPSPTQGVPHGRIVRSTEFYYKENPDRWAAETQSDMLWLTEAEWRTLVPRDPKPGDRADVAAAIQKRFFGTIAIDYMEGSVNSLAPRETRMTLTVQRVTADSIAMRLDGYGRLGKEHDEALRKEKGSRGCEVRVLGFVNYNRRADSIDRFDVVGIGEAWGNKMDYVQREIRVEAYPWLYGIACELVRGDSPMDRIPPYNMLHYGGPEPYFAGQRNEDEADLENE